jgi:hypothetical protein
VFPKFTHLKYKIDNCTLNNIKLDDSDKKNILPTGCLVDFTNKINDDILSTAYDLSIDDHKRLVQKIKNEINTIKNNKNDVDKSIEDNNNAIADTYAQIEIVKLQDIANENLVKVLQNNIANVKVNTGNIDSNRQILRNTLAFQYQNNELRLSALPDKTNIIQKKFNSGFFTLLFKYVAKDIKENIDPYKFWIGQILANHDTLVNVDNPISFINNDKINYRNDAIIRKVFDTKASYEILIEVYNDFGDSPIGTLLFRKDAKDDIESWFSKPKLVYTSITGLKEHKIFGFFSIKGHDEVKRRFFINAAYTGCTGDPGFMAIPFRNDVCPQWDNKYTAKIIVASDGVINFGGENVSGYKGKNDNDMVKYNIGTRMLIYSRRVGQDDLAIGASLNSGVSIFEFPPQNIDAGDKWPRIAENTYQTEVSGSSYGNGIYVASANTVWGYNQTNEHRPSGAFDKRNGNANGVSLYAGNQCDFSATEDNASPILLNLKMPLKISLTYYKIQARTEKDILYQTPSKWTIVGSNDETVWDTLDTQSNIVNWSVNEQKTFYLGTPSKPYNIFRMIIYRNSAPNFKHCISIAEFRIFGKIV